MSKAKLLLGKTFGYVCFLEYAIYFLLKVMTCKGFPSCVYVNRLMDVIYYTVCLYFINT